MDADSPDPGFTLVPGRSCGSCTLCCKVFSIKQFDKPQFKWCPHCAVGKGCTIYETRPAMCRDFFCSWRLDDSLGEHWYPAHSKMVVATNARENKVTIYVDATRLDAWRHEPFLTQIRRWADEMNAKHGQCIVRQGRDTIVILPNGPKNLGEVPDGHAIVVVRNSGRAANAWDAIAVPPDDPRLAAALARREAENS